MKNYLLIFLFVQSLHLTAQAPMDMDLLRVQFMRHINGHRQAEGILPLQSNPKIETFALRHAGWLADHPGILVYSGDPRVAGANRRPGWQFNELGFHDFYAENIGVLPVIGPGDRLPEDIPFEDAKKLYKSIQEMGCTAESLAELAFLYWKNSEGSNDVLLQPAIISCFFTGIIENGKFFFVLSALGNPYTEEE